MSNFIYKYIKIASESEKLTQKKSNISFWQSKIWTEILTRTKQAKDVILCTTPEGEILIERRTIFREYCGLYILGADPSLITEGFLDSLKREIVNASDLFLQIEPIDKVPSTEYQVLSTAPFRRFIEPVTAILNLEGKIEDALLASFAEKGRYNIKLAQKRGVTTRWVSASTQYQVLSTKYERKTQDYSQAFYDLLEETTERDGFSHNSLAYYRHFVETLEKHDAGGLLIAEKDGILHAAGIFAYLGDTGIYYYGASSSNKEIRRDMATYLLQWDAIREGMKRGCSEYDFLGISPDGTGKLAGVTEFKLRFNPEKRRLPEEMIIIYRPMLLKLLQMVNKIRKMFR